MTSFLWWTLFGRGLRAICCDYKVGLCCVPYKATLNWWCKTRATGLYSIHLEWITIAGYLDNQLCF